MTPYIGPRKPVITEGAIDLYGRILAGEQPGDADCDATAQLRFLNLVREDPTLGFVVVDPAYVGAQWAASLYSEAARAVENAAAVGDALRPLQRVYDNRPVGATGIIEYLLGSAAINDRLGQVLGGCTTELLVCQPGGPRSQETLDGTFDRDIATLRRGVRMHTLYHEEARSGEAMSAWVSTMTAAGAEIRTLAEPFQRMIIIDRRIAVIPGNEILITSREAVAYMVNDPGVAEHLAKSFERDWARADPWGRQPTGTLTERQEIIMKGLAAGDSQVVIARRLGMSKRAMAEAIAELKDAYNAKSLFELAHKWTLNAGGPA
ncbi:hypothetical protein [Kitasatospora sp. NPDC001175]|uniref:hypothetical protein n=1 Tax=Kitasatospora sp. NPDC001175 TaxID=3157103 RepID=UPI003D0873C4